MKPLYAGSFLCLALLCSPILAQEKKDKKEVPKSTATLENVKYGTHERQVLDFYKAKSDKPTPVVFYIHGGGWQNGSKAMSAATVKKYLDAGISVAAINYRYVKNGVELKIDPPVKAPLEDAARALQFVRSKAVEWNIDKKRIGATGGSAGACSSLWLAFHADMADPKSDDPIARESTRLYCAAVNGAQVSLDPKELREWMPNYGYGAHAFGLPSFQALYDNRDKVLQAHQGILADRARQQGRSADLHGVPQPEGAAGRGRKAGRPDPLRRDGPEAGRATQVGRRRGGAGLSRPNAPAVQDLGRFPDRPPAQVNDMTWITPRGEVLRTPRVHDEHPRGSAYLTPRRDWY